MDKKQFEELINKLEEIRCGIVDVETNTEDKNIDDVLTDVRTYFYDKLEAKTGWGRNEIKLIFEIAVEEAT